MAIEGPLHELGLSDVLQLLDLSRKTGLLTVRGGNREHPAVVRFQRGAVVGAEYPGTSRRLGHLLLRAGKITQAGLEAAAVEQRVNPGKPFGSILVQLGSVSEEDVRHQLRFQIEETIFELIRWQDGYFRFEETPPLESDAVAIRLSTESLLMEAVRRIDEWTTLQTRIADMELIPKLVAADPDSAPILDLRPAEWEVLAEVDGERTLKSIAKELARGDFDVAKIAFALISTGIIEVAHAVRHEADSGSRATDVLGISPVEEALRTGDIELATRLLEAVLGRFSGRAEVQLLAGRVHVRAGRWTAAHESFSRAAHLDPLMSAAHYHLGFAAARIGDLSGAEAAWRTYLRLGESDAQHQETVFRAGRASAALRRLLEQEAV